MLNQYNKTRRHLSASMFILLCLTLMCCFIVTSLNFHAYDYTIKLK